MKTSHSYLLFTAGQHLHTLSTAESPHHYLRLAFVCNHLSLFHSFWPSLTP
jgi:hypothetical protein